MKYTKFSGKFKLSKKDSYFFFKIIGESFSFNSKYSFSLIRPKSKRSFCSINFIITSDLVNGLFELIISSYSSALSMSIIVLKELFTIVDKKDPEPEPLEGFFTY